MQVVIVQGMTCLGKSTLCKQLEKDLPKCRYFALDEYKENMWDKIGFDSNEQREYQTTLARELFYSDINNAIKSLLYDYILIDYVFTDKYWSELLSSISSCTQLVKTLYLKTYDLKVHKKIWESRSRDFSIRHAAHGATHYHNGVGSEYINSYDNKEFMELPTINETLEIKIAFNPYSRSESYDDILAFIKDDFKG